MEFIKSIFGSPTPWTSWLTLTMSALLVLLLVVSLLNRVRFVPKQSNTILFISSFILTLIAVEAILRLSGITLTSLEKRHGKYIFINHGSFQDSLHIWTPNSEHQIGDIDNFLYSRQTNSQGLSDKEWTVDKPDSIYRIIALGDSFTEGDGAPADSTWPALLQSQLNLEQPRVEIMNAGVCGSDPFFEIMLLKKSLLDYSPDHIIITISMQDLLQDIAIRGDWNRFDPTSKKLPELYEVVYAYSHMARLIYNRILGYSWVLIRETDPQLQEKLILNSIPSICEKLAEIQSQHTELQIDMVLYPHQYQVETGYVEDLKNSIANNCTKYGIRLSDIRPCYLEHTEGQRGDYEKYWWKSDGHHNSNGYLMMAQCIGESLGLDSLRQ